jgi:SWI/SNF chromatin-remodeling complex subunit SWI1
MMPQQMGQMPQQMGQMPGQMQQMQQMQNQMQSQMQGQMPGQMPNQMFPQGMPQPRNNLEQQKMLYQMQLQQHLARNNLQMPGQGIAQAQAQAQAHMQAQAQAQAEVQAHARNVMAARQQMGMPNGQMPPNAMRPQQAMQQQQGVGRVQNADQFMKNLTLFMNSKQLPLEMTPAVDSRPVSLMMLFQAVTKFQGYRNVTQANGWPQISHALGFPPQHSPTAPQQLRSIYERNLLKFEEAWMAQQNRARMQQQGMQGGMPNNMANMQQSMPNKGMPQGQMQRGQMMQPVQQQQQGPMQHMQGQTSIKAVMSQQQSPGLNGFSMPQAAQQPQVGMQSGHARNSLSRSVQATPTAEEFTIASPAQRKPGSMSLPSHADSAADVGMPFPPPPNSDPDVYVPCVREITTYGGIELEAVYPQGVMLEKLKPTVPHISELGSVDIHALTRSIQCGIRGEMRVALDTLATLTSAPDPKIFISVAHCDDLVETLIECAENQVEPLAEDTVEVSDEILVNSFEEVSRACRLEKISVRDISAVGSPEYDLDRCVDRLICITTILRNMSFHPDNQKYLADETVIEFLCVVIRYLGTRNMLLRTHSNTLDFMKDIIIFLSNIAAEVEIPGREQAFCLLQFLLAFAPSPPPTWNDDQLFFTPYEPSLQPYLSHAVDSLAKLFARDEPNRTHYRSLLTSDTSATPSSFPYELLSRTFGLAICVIPEQFRDGRPVNLLPLIEARKPLLMQGLLAADILASLAPNHESGVARAWLSSGNGFAQNLFFLIQALCSMFETQVRRQAMVPQSRNQMPIMKDLDLVYIASKAVSLIKRLCEKARDPNDRIGASGIPPNALPSKEMVLSLLSMQARELTEMGLLADLVAYSRMAG